MATQPYSVHLTSTDGERRHRTLTVHAHDHDEAREVAEEYYTGTTIGEGWNIVLVEAPDVV